MPSRWKKWTLSIRYPSLPSRPLDILLFCSDVPGLGPTDGLVSGFLGSDGPDAVLEKEFYVREVSCVRACVCMSCKLSAWSNKLECDAGS